MRITVNARTHEIEGPTLARALEELGFAGTAYATAHNGGFVPRASRDTTVLRDGDRVEVLSPMQGG